MSSQRSLPPLPWKEVNAIGGPQVAGILRLKPSKKERGKYPCLKCGSSDALHAYDGSPAGFKCFSCGKWWSNVDAAAVVWGLEPAEACKRLAGSLGILLPDDGSGPFRPTPTPPGPIKAAQNRNAGGAGSSSGTPSPEILEIRARVYKTILNSLDLTDPGKTYLNSRGLDPEASDWYGFRSIDGPEGWGWLRSALMDSHSWPELVVAGFGKKGEAQVFLPFYGKEPALLIPYLDGEEVKAVRFRNLKPNADPRNRYREPLSARPHVPFNAGVLKAIESGGDLHIAEGELDAWTLHLADVVAIGIPGASAWRPEWSQMVRSASRVLLWYDPDEAGEAATGKTAESLAGTWGGAAWVRERVKRVRRRTGDEGQDVNDLHRAGRLGRYLEDLKRDTT